MGQKPIEGSNPSLSANPSCHGSASQLTNLTSSPYRKLLICRPGFEAALLEELGDRNVPDTERAPGSPGLVGIGRRQNVPVPICIFERQRLSVNGFIPVEGLKPIAESSVRDVFGSLLKDEPAPWTLHAYAMAEGLGRRISGIANVLLRLASRIQPALEAKQLEPTHIQPDTRVIQLCLTEMGLWHGADAARDLSHPAPGGVGRYRLDPRSPSRSYLKIEEAFDLLGVEPRAGDRVVDLGAAPGGWTLAFLRRGCRVTAVDHGAMRIPAEYADRLTHRRENGLTFGLTDGQPVDWLACDMLIPPGPALGLLRRWVGGKLAHRFICNIKIPQQHPWVAIKPVDDWLRSQKGLRYRIRQTYHDRREVTVMGEW
ncbi:MAG: hypothetical protein EPO31_00335 [Gammaproteobacteria bacterium]|nr:MAG: hypothetical protein EPO31_00335 [Gammaproteobacteria bacterium]